jgi:hypothetical protein
LIGLFARMKPSAASLSESNPSPWLTQRIAILKRTGHLSLVGELRFDPRALSMPHVISVVRFVRVLDISRTPVTSLLGCPPFPRLTVFIGDRSGISDFANFRALKTATTISLKDTPVARLQTYRLSLLLALGPDDNLVSINGSQISSELRARVKAFPQFCNDLVNRGWIATPKPPAGQESVQLCQRYDVEPPFVDSDTDDDDSFEHVPEEPTPTCFEDMLFLLQERHREMQRKGKAQFGLLDNDEEMVGILRRDHLLDGKSPDINTFTIVKRLCAEFSRNR